jgi:hypothetical protein
MKKHTPKNQDGVILILSLMIMAILLSMALGFGVFIISDLRQAAEIDDSMFAYYSADSGIERTLYLFRKADKEKIGGFSGAVGTLSDNDKTGDVDGDGQSDWSIEDSTDYEPTFFRQRLFNGQSVKLYFLGRNDGSNLSRSIKLEWLKGLNSPKLQVVFTQLDPVLVDGVLVYYTDIDKVEVSDTIELSNPVCFDFKDRNPSGFSLLAPADYVMELRVLGSSNGFIENLAVTAHDEKKGINGCNTPAYNNSYDKEAISNITLKAVGNRRNTRQSVYVNIPSRDPVSGLLGFVLFSQEDITKGY